MVADTAKRLLYLALGAMFVQQTFASIGRTLPLVIAPAIIEDLHIDPALVGVYVGAAALASLVFQLGCQFGAQPCSASIPPNSSSIECRMAFPASSIFKMRCPGFRLKAAPAVLPARHCWRGFPPVPDSAPRADNPNR